MNESRLTEAAPLAWSGSSRKRSSGMRNAPCAQTMAAPRASAEKMRDPTEEDDEGGGDDEAPEGLPVGEGAAEGGERGRVGGAEEVEEAPGGEEGEERGEGEGVGEEGCGEGEGDDGGVVDAEARFLRRRAVASERDSGRERALRSMSSGQGRAPESARLTESRRRARKARVAAGLASAEETEVGAGETVAVVLAAAGRTVVGRRGGEAAAMAVLDLRDGCAARERERGQRRKERSGTNEMARGRRFLNQG
uniref:Uncharacterized protein n=1 Tax=Oryza meridionalis TaxID=40149 RepID=A0A0E0F1M0_9ORYZ